MRRFVLSLFLMGSMLLAGCSSGETVKSGDGEGVSDKAAYNIFLIDIEGKGGSGKPIGTGDYVVAVEGSMKESQKKIIDAFTELFSIKEQWVGEAKLYNALYQSELKVESVTIDKGVATVRLTGSFMIGGALDGPRVQAQLFETVLQFEEVQEAVIYINGKKLEEVISLKG